MSRMASFLLGLSGCIPRMHGDEPEYQAFPKAQFMYSPYARG